MRHPSVKLPPLAFAVYRAFGAENSELRGQRILIACSGGLDSVVLVDVMCRLKARWGAELMMAHIHHGVSSDVSQTTNRDQAARFVEEIARSRGLPFVLSVAEANTCADFQIHQPLQSEDDFRRFRLRALDQMFSKYQIDRVAMGHHADDLMETRLLRLIRGTGPAGLTAMSMISKTKVRPFLGHSKATLTDYAREAGLKWIEDVSNGHSHYFRNWIRNEWLPQLNARQPGAASSLSRSLCLLAESGQAAAAGAVSFDGIDKGGIGGADMRRNPGQLKRTEFSILTIHEKKLCIIELSRRFQIRDFGHGKVEEILKRLERLEATRQRQTKFQVGGLVWKIDSQTIDVSKA